MDEISIVRGITAASSGMSSSSARRLTSDEVPETPLDEACWEGLRSMSIESLFPVQRICTHLITNRLTSPKFSPFDSDLCVSAPTGSGKSLAYLLPIVHGLAGRKQPLLRALIVLPTRDLALQVAGVAAQFKSVNVHCFVGQHSMAEERAALLNGSTDIAVATMGRLVDHLVIGSLDLSYLRWLVVDEADRMLSKSDLDKWSMVLSAVPESTQRLLFSATMTANPLKLNKLKLTRPVFVSVGGGRDNDGVGLPDSITHKYIVVPNKSMKVRGILKVLEMAFGGEGELLKAPAQRCLVFCRTAANVDSLSSLLASVDLGFTSRPFSGNMTASAREKLLSKFEKGSVQCLIATDVITRGIDISDIDVVVNYDVPKHATTYVHRAGRTGRANKAGLVVTLAESKEMRHFRKEIVGTNLKSRMKRFGLDFSALIKHSELESLVKDDELDA